MDHLAQKEVVGSDSCQPGITPGSGPGIGFEVAIRCKFCTLDAHGNITTDYFSLFPV